MIRPPVLQVESLQTAFFTPKGVVKAVDRVSFDVRPGSVLGLVGESGSGKSVTGLSIMGLVDLPGRVIGGRVLFKGQDLLAIGEGEMRKIRGARIAMIFQDALTALNPVLTIETQLVDAVLAHQPGLGYHAARERARNALGQVGIPSPDERLSAYPHQFSGGMRQRVVIAIALLHQPDVIIADEATTALDVTIQAQILSEVQKLCRDKDMGLVWITHDLSVIAGLADNLCVMYAGQIVESGSVDGVFSAPMHPYTSGLIRSLPSLNQRGKPMFQISGTTPSLLDLPAGCAFRTRCARSDAECEIAPALQSVAGHEVRCVHPHLGEVI